MSFDKHSNFNKQANFTEVKFGENKPVLEVELNELQQIQNEARADIIRDSIPSGFTQLGDIDYEYCLNNENKIKLKTDSVAYVNGYRITIPKDTIIDIGKAPEKDVREDLVFLEVWKEEVNSTSELTLEGGEGQVEIPNNIKDSRYPIETTHRVALKWRIRHVSDVDFEGNYDGMSWSSWSYKSLTWAQGGNITPISEPSDSHRVGYEHAHFKNSAGLYEIDSTIINFMKTNFNDPGLFVSGDGTVYYKNLLKTLDGYVYAIPMFRLYRKPSCGKSIPFEYDKINPKVDYSKFTKLIQDEKVERVHSENIKGRSLVNLLDMTKWVNYDLLTNSVSKSTGDDNNFSVSGRFSLGGEYTLIFKSSNCTNGNLLTIHGVSSDAVNTWVISSIPNGFHKIKFTEHSTNQTDRIRCYAGNGTSPFTITDLMILEGDWTDKEIPEYFTGLKSLGEDDNNVVTVKNGILNDDTYDINDGNQKLNTFSSVTHVLSENTIIPTIEAVVNKGDDSTPLEKLNSKLETEGNEVIEFTKIKGKTIQNLWDNASTVVTISHRYQRLCLSTIELVANKTYTLVVNVQGGAVDFKKFEGNEVIQTLQPGVHVVSYTPNINSKVLLIALGEVGAKYNMKALLLDGDFTNTPLEDIPFVEGIKSVGENENNKIVLKSCNKNIWTGDTEYSLPFKHCVHKQLLSKGTRFKLSYELLSTDYLFVFLSNEYSSLINHDQLYQAVVANGKGKEISYVNSQTVINNDEGYKYIYVTGGVGNSSGIKIRNIQLEEGDTRTDYTPPLRNAQEIYLKEPLRSLTSTVYDEIIGNKITRRVEKLIFNGSEAWVNVRERNLTNTMYFEIPMPIRWKTRYHLNNRFRVKHTGDSASIWTTDSEVCNYDDYWHMLVVRIDRSKLTTQDLAGFKTWLANNPLEVYHEINPVEEYLENVYEKESIKTYQLDAPLRSLPNGVKDEIKDGVLIRRCGECAITGAGMFLSPGWENATLVTTFEGGTEVPTDCVYDTSGTNKLLCNTLNWNDFTTQLVSAQSGGTGVRGITTHPHGKFVISLAKSELTSQDEAGLITWLKNNPTRVVYQLVNPTETILTESKPQTANFSLQRQFAEGNWLRELPNGVKDTVENGKVIRRVGKVVLNGSETWQFDQGNMLKDTLMFSSPLVCSSTSNYVLSNKFDSDNTLDNGWETDTETICVVLGSRLRIRILKSKLATQDARGLTTWLQQNPTTVLYELATPVEEALSTDNYMSYPSHEFNTYCGSMYVGEGRNYVINDNKMPTEDTIVVETDFREIEGKVKVEDCKYKKNDEGYDTMCLLPTNKNLFDGIWEKGMINTDGSIAETQSTTRKYSKNFIRVIPGKTYIFSANLGEDRINLKGYDLNKKLVHNFGYSAKHTIPEGCYFVRFYNGHDSSVNLDNIKAQFELGETVTSYVEGINTFRSFENTESNDIDDLRHQVSLTGFNYDKILNESFDKLLRGEL